MASQGVASMFALALLLGAFASIPQSDSPFFILLSSSLSPSHDWVEYFYANFIFFDKGSFYYLKYFKYYTQPLHMQISSRVALASLVYAWSSHMFLSPTSQTFFLLDIPCSPLGARRFLPAFYSARAIGRMVKPRRRPAVSLSVLVHLLLHGTVNNPFKNKTDDGKF
jgi:hypothetical protein